MLMPDEETKFLEEADTYNLVATLQDEAHYYNRRFYQLGHLLEGILRSWLLLINSWENGPVRYLEVNYEN